MTTASGEGGIRCLLVRAGEYRCAVPLNQVRRVVASLATHPLPNAAPELLGLAEFGGEPLPVLELARLVGAPEGAASPHPVTVVAWAGPPRERELVGLAADQALSIVEVPVGSLAGGQAGLVSGEALVDGAPVRVLNLEHLGAA
ncbi:MAG TPA: chemotaxis protein CheW [Thermoanaerobaculaceae bacterium]|nr:chemotaxis protein CheW [Thermoanaerobaculaceae bacterium]HRS16156.1 chemotaxis protein CheW [Thermoanaerobaculaceae bacterium]